MHANFDYFIILAEMRTGSNFLEQNINAFANLECVGEAFNPHFVGYPNSNDLLGVTLDQRVKDPEILLSKIKNLDGLGGFRFFHDHDPRVLEIAMEDRRCAKIVLTRNPLDTYVSRKIAAATGQWKLTDAKFRRSEVVSFDPIEFQAHLSDLHEFQVTLLNDLQRLGQAAFYLSYEDLQKLETLNGLAAFLGQSDQLDKLNKKLKKQNPTPLSDRISNYDDVAETLQKIDPFNLSRTPSFEPRRGPAVPTYFAAPHAPLMYVPIPSGPTNAVQHWLADIDTSQIDDLNGAFTQKTLRQWKRGHPGHRTFTVLRHPLARAYDSFCRNILCSGPENYTEIRKALRKAYRLPLPAGDPGEGYGPDQHRAVFLAFLVFLKDNLAGQTGIRVDAAWATQSAFLQGVAYFHPPDMILREDRLRGDLAFLAACVGRASPETIQPDTKYPFALSDIYDADLESAARDTYKRDYLQFGFSDWADLSAEV